MEVHSLIVPVIRRPEYNFGLEQVGEHTFIHSRVFAKWTPALKERYARDLDLLMSLHGGPLLVLCKTTNHKLRKFAQLFGFEHALRLPPHNDGSESDILIRKNNNG